MTMAVRVGISDSSKSDKDSNSRMQKIKCYGFKSTHKVEHINKSVRQRIVFVRYKGLCLNWSHKGDFA